MTARPVTTRPIPERVVVVGCAGSGKTTLAREVAARLDARHIERDALGALAACFAVAVAGLAALWLAAQALLGHPHLVISKGITVHDTVGVAQLVFASVAGAGALVALVVAYRRQRVSEVATVEDKDRWEATAAHDRTRVFNERFTAIATQFGDDQPAVRLAGVHAMAGLADDWEENRQTCVDVLCAYLRLPYDPDPGDDAEPKKLAAYRANREVRHTIIRLIGDHLRPDVDPGKSWQGLNLDFTSVVFDGGDFTLAAFSGGTVRFGGAAFSGGAVSFDGAEFCGGGVIFGGAAFSGGTVSFDGARFSGGTVSFGAEFCGGAVSFEGAAFCGGGVIFGDARFSGGTVSFRGAEFSGGEVNFDGAEFSGGTVSFRGAAFSGGTVSFYGARFSGGTVSFYGAAFSGGTVRFGDAAFSGGTVSFYGAEFSGGAVILSGAFSGGKVFFADAKFSGAKVFFDGARFSGGKISFSAEFSGGTVSFRRAEFCGGEVRFSGAEFSGGTADFRDSRPWSQPPKFDWGGGTPPEGVMLPTDATATPT